MDPNATNYDPNATCDDGSCDFACPDPGDCDNGDCADGEEVWDGTQCACVAINVPNPSSCIDDGDCTNGVEMWNPNTCACDNIPQMLGCMDPNATNYDPNATCDDGSCDFACPDPGDCDNGDCADGEEVWDGSTCSCVAINVPNPASCVDDGDCTNGLEMWNPNTCACDNIPQTLGCMDPNATNYDPNATCDDGSCILFDCPDLMLNVGDSCDDGNPESIDDTVDMNCSCAGTVDCGSVTTLLEMPCDDGQDCTTNDVQMELSDGTVCEPCLGEPVDCSMTDQVEWLPCDDNNEFTIEDLVQVLACDNDIVCIPCEGVAPVTTVFLPTAFMFDGQNDRFGPYSDAPVRIIAFRIYDRWGELVFNVENRLSSEPESFWNGRIDGEKVEQGVYVYTINFETGDSERFESGTITVIR